MADLTLLFLTGLSGSGKGWFFDNVLKPTGNYQKLKSMTTRKPRAGEKDARDGGDYYFVTEEEFYKTERATTLFVNELQWENKETRKNYWKKMLPFKLASKLIDKKMPNPKWLYGVPASEIVPNSGKILVYDVIQPRYVRALQKYCADKGFKANTKILWFQPPENNFDIASKRAVMGKQDLDVRTRNTCDRVDFLNAGLNPDWKLLSSENKSIYPVDMIAWLNKLCPCEDNVAAGVRQMTELGFSFKKILNSSYWVKEK